MARTALDMSPDELRAYHPGSAPRDPARIAARRRRAWRLARRAAQLLRARFGATRVMVFGSLTRRGAFTPWSDLDLAASGIPPDQFYTAVAAVAGLSPELKVDLVDADRCPARIRSRIDLEAREV